MFHLGLQHNNLFFRFVTKNYYVVSPVDASPKAVSGRTSYYQTRLAFHSLPQVIREDCTPHRFGPPPNFHQGSTCSRQARLASGLEHSTNALLTLAFATPTPQKGLDKLNIQTRWLVLQKARRHGLHTMHNLILY